MRLAYTSLYKIISISLKSIGWRQFVKPSRYRNAIYTYQLKSDRVVRQLPIPKYGHHSHPSTSLSSFWKRIVKTFLPADNKGICFSNQVLSYITPRAATDNTPCTAIIDIKIN